MYHNIHYFYTTRHDTKQTDTDSETEVAKQSSTKLHEDDCTDCFDNQRRTRLGCSPSHRARHSARSIYRLHRLHPRIILLNSFYFLCFSFLFSLFFLVPSAARRPLSSPFLAIPHVRAFLPFPIAPL
jgi:hypothetical protein